MDALLEKKVPRMLVLIIDHSGVKKATEVLEKYRVPVQLLCKGKGTASSDLMNYLGIGETEKAVLLCPVLKLHVSELFDVLNRDLKLNKPGKGIAFTFPISGASSFVLEMLNDEARQKIKEHLERRVEQVDHTITHSLLMVTINQGYSEAVMTAAKQAGAAGGTVLLARRLGLEAPMQKWGINIQPEKEIIYILAEQEKKLAIMKVLGEKYGLHSEAQGLIISIPVDAVAGLEVAALDIDANTDS